MTDLDATLDRLVAFRVPGTGIHPAWHATVEIDLRERILLRPQQRAYLARYARQDMWRADVSIPEIDLAVRKVSAVVSQENEVTSLGENHG